MANDAAAVTAAVRAAYAPYVARIGREPKPMGADYQTVIRDHQIWVIEDGRDIMAVLELIADTNHFLIENVAVLPAHQGQGHGLRLLHFADAEARRQGFREIRLYTNELFIENIALYSRVGYRETRRAGEGMSRIVFMQKAV